MINSITIKINSMLNIKCTRNNINCHNKQHALEIISELAAKSLNLPPIIIFNAVLMRERIGSTGIGNGIALPHAKLEDNVLLKTIGVFIRLKQPILFDSIDDQPVDLIFSLFMPSKQLKMHLHILSMVITKFKNKKICSRLRSAKGNTELYHILTEVEKHN